MIFSKDDNTIYNQPDDVFEAFTDILEATGSGIFKNIQFDYLDGVLEYDSTAGHCVKYFNMEQGTPELVSDIMQWLFSMLDAAANL
jgi:hypothetical protein